MSSEMTFVAFDTETANSSRASICSLGATVVTNGVVTDERHQPVALPEEERPRVVYASPYVRARTIDLIPRLDDPPLDREDAGHVPPQRLGKGEEPQRLRSRRAIDHEDVPLPRPRVGAHLEERQHLLGAGDDRELLGRDGIDPGRVSINDEV